MLEIDVSLVSFEIGASQQQAAPTIDAAEVRKGSTGNFIVDPDQVTIGFTLAHEGCIDLLVLCRGDSCERSKWFV
jgi:hypothetical protein